jgi:hypothetical protein
MDIEKSLLQAAEITGLETPFVHVEKLGDFSISYKVGGLLKEIDRIITARSDFKKNVIDNLHNSDIEIVSPTYMNQRVFSEDYVCMPPKEDNLKTPKEKKPEVQTEDIIFDKAIMAQMLDRIYTITDKLPGDRKEMEEKIKEITDSDKRDELKEQIGMLAKIQEDIDPEIQILKDLPDITSMPDDKDDEYIEKLVTAEKDITLLDNRHEDLKKKIFKAIEQE